MKKVTILLIALFAIFVLFGCETDSYEQDHPATEQHTTGSVELLSAVRNYDVHSFGLDLDIELVQFYFFLHQEQLRLFMREECDATLNTYVNLFTMNTDGTNIQLVYRTMLDESVDYFYFIGFEKHDDGYITLVSTDNEILPPYTREDYFDGVLDFEIEYAYMYRRISPTGEIVSVVGIDALNNEERQIRISDLAFDLDGNAVASVAWLPASFDLSAGQGMIPEGVIGQSFFIFDNGLTGDFHELEDLTHSHGLFNRTNDGQIIVQSHAWHDEEDVVMFYEVDFENIAIIDGTIVGSESPIDSINGVFPAPEISEFDLYFIVNERELIGYCKSDGTFTILIDFLQHGVPLAHGRLNRNNFLLWDDGRITIVNTTWSTSLRRLEATLFLLTPSVEPDIVIEREIIKFGGVQFAGTPLIDMVSVYNRQSDTHQIEVVNYSFDEMDRLRIELMMGEGPDMFILSWWGGDELVSAMSEGSFLLDLYQMIDADPDISRDDFFPSVLSTWENSRGELMQIAPSFIIETIIGMQSVFPEAPANWNYADFIAFYEEARVAGYEFPFGQTLDRQTILEMILFVDDTFFCEQTAVAKFDSESFINVLNFVMTIPAEQGWEMIPEDVRLSGQWDPTGDLLRGEKLLLPFESIRNPEDFRILQMRLGGITAFGLPSNDAPIHIAYDASGTGVGIRSNSPHIEAAWEFVRLGLLPGTSDVFHDRLTLPLRTDRFEQLINRELSRIGPSQIFRFEVGTLEVPPMTESDAELLRDIISNIGHKPIRGHPVQNIVNEDVRAFFAGTQSAEDTARIIQSRVQIFLSERER